MYRSVPLTPGNEYAPLASVLVSMELAWSVTMASTTGWFALSRTTPET